MAFVTSQGTTFTFDGDTFKCVDISYETSSPSRERVDMSTLDIAHNGSMAMVDAPLKPVADPAKFTITYKFEGTMPLSGTQGTLTTAEGSGTFLCTASSISRKTNAYVEGSATFEEIID